MHRRSALALLATIPLAGCSALGLGGDSYLDEEVEAGNVYTFDATAGDAEITIEVTDAGELEDEDGEEMDVDASSVQIRRDGSPVFAESVDESAEETFEYAFDEDGEYELLVTSGRATVTIGPGE